MRRLAPVLLLIGLAGCGGPEREPPADQGFEGLPVAGSMAFAQAAGFTNCIERGTSMRCRKADVTLAGRGPFEAAVDLIGSDGSGGFDELTLWHPTDQNAVYRVGDALKEQGWQLCRTGTADRGDQAIYTRAGAPVRYSIDVSYWGKRRVRVIPERGQPTGRCW